MAFRQSKGGSRRPGAIFQRGNRDGDIAIHLLESAPSYSRHTPADARVEGLGGIGSPAGKTKAPSSRRTPKRWRVRRRIHWTLKTEN
jgi:hypothetical protein